MSSTYMHALRAIVTGLLLAVSGVVSATLTYTVNSTADLVDTDLSDGVCATSAGTCTLRAAIMQSNVVPSASPVIVLPAGTYSITRPVLGSDGPDEGDFNFLAPSSPTTAVTTIIGAGAATTVIDANHLDRAFNILNGRWIEIRGVTITNGNAPPNDEVGGAIVSNGSLSLIDVHLTASSAEDIGGCLYLAGDPSERFLIERSELVQCSGRETGGAIYLSTGSLTVTNSSIAGNSAKNAAGLFASSGTTVKLVNDTIFGNAATASGGGVYSYARMTIFNTTVASNSADADDDGDGQGAGLLLVDPAIVEVSNSIIAGNYFPGSRSSDDCDGPITTHGVNLLGSTPVCQKTDCLPTGIEGCAIIEADGHHALFNDLFLLGNFGDYGGPTRTIPLLAGSNAIDAGDTACAGPDGPIHADQRGFPRPVGGHCDAGAFETQGTDAVFGNGFD